MVKTLVEPGFTLLELLLVLMIVGVIAAVAAPRWTGWTADLERHASSLGADLRYAQNLAMHQGRNYALCLEGDGYSLYATECGGNAQAFADGRTRRSLPGVSVTGDERVVFLNPMGSVSDGAQIGLTAGGRTLAVTVEAETGYVSVDAQ